MRDTATCTPEGTCVYTFRRAIPENARGSYSIGIESRRMETLLAGTTRERNVQYGAPNKVIHFTVDGTPVQPRREVVTTAQCNQCHTRITAHGREPERSRDVRSLPQSIADGHRAPARCCESCRIANSPRKA